MTSKPFYGHPELKRLKDRHLKMANLTLAGLTQQKIADIIGCSINTVSYIQRSPLFVAELNRRRKLDNGQAEKMEVEAHLGKVRSILQQNSELAAETQVDLLGSEDDSIRLRSAGSILDRVLGSKDSPSAGVSVNVQISGDDTKLLIIALKESQHAQSDYSTADGSTAASSENGQGDVHQEAISSSGE